MKNRVPARLHPNNNQEKKTHVHGYKKEKKRKNKRRCSERENHDGARLHDKPGTDVKNEC